MRGCSLDLTGPALVMLLAAIACSAGPSASARDVADANDTGRTLAAQSEGERALLAEVSKLPSGVARKVAGSSVLADAPYTAASGRTCRLLHVAPAGAAGPRDRLACSNGQTWFFVPNVFGSDDASEGK